MQVVLFLSGTLVLSSVLYVSADTEIYSNNIDLYNNNKASLNAKSTEDSTSEANELKKFQDENINLTALQKHVEEGRSSFFGLKLDQLLTGKCLSKSNSFNIALLNQLLTSNGLAPLIGTSTLTTTILNQLLLANGELEIAAFNQILQELGINPIPVPGNTLDRATQNRILEKLLIPSPKDEKEDVTDFATLNQCLEFIGLQQVTGDGQLGRRRLRRILNRGGPIDSDTLDTFLTCLKITPDEPAPITQIDPTILSQILNALRIPNEGCAVATSSTTMTIAAAAIAALGSLLAVAVPFAFGFLIAYLLRNTTGANTNNDYDYNYYDDIVPNLRIGYTPPPVFVPPPILNVPRPFGTPLLK